MPQTQSMAEKLKQVEWVTSVNETPHETAEWDYVILTMQSMLHRDELSKVENLGVTVEAFGAADMNFIRLYVSENE